MSLPELLLITFIAALLTDFATGLGAVPFFFVPTLSDKLNGALTAAAGGMMTSASLVLLVGEGLKRAPGMGVWEVGVGMIAGAVFFLITSLWIRNHEEFDIAGLRKAGGSTALLIVAAMTIHSLPEGVAVGVSYGSAHATGDLNFGGLVAFVIAVHNVPEGMAIAVALRSRGVSTWACVGWAVFSSVPQPLAAVPAAWAVWLFEPLLPAGMGFAAGAMMYLVIADLLPEARERCGNATSAIGFFAGLIAMIVLGRVIDVLGGG